MNYLFSCTRQWNPGDEFILFGLINLLRWKGNTFNPIIFNRNPDIRENYTFLNPLRRIQPGFKGKGIVNSFIRMGFADNSFKNYTDSSIIDKVYFAGSPEWQSRRLNELYQLILESDIQVEYHGIGAWKSFSRNDLSTRVVRVLDKASAITVRDAYSFKVLSGVRPVKHVACPALFASGINGEVLIRRNEQKFLGIIFSTYKTMHGNRVSRMTYERMIGYYRYLIEQSKQMGWECEVICHYIDEIEHCKKVFGDLRMRYSFDAKDYIEIYSRYDFVVGARVHGVGMAASMNIPGILISHDSRGSTGEKFGVKVLSVNELEVASTSSLIFDECARISAISMIGKAKKEALAEYSNIL